VTHHHDIYIQKPFPLHSFALSHWLRFVRVCLN